jgi:hypothetical protein
VSALICIVIITRSDISAGCPANCLQITPNRYFARHSYLQVVVSGAFGVFIEYLAYMKPFFVKERSDDEGRTVNCTTLKNRKNLVAIEDENVVE